MVPLPVCEGVQPRIGRQTRSPEDSSVRAEVLDVAGQARAGAEENRRAGGTLRDAGRQPANRQDEDPADASELSLLRPILPPESESDQELLQRQRLNRWRRDASDEEAY